MTNRKFAVVDTNTIVARLLSPRSTPALALERLGNRYTLLASQETIYELSKVLAREKLARIPVTARDNFMHDYLSNIVIVEVRETVQACRDPKDDKILSLAVNGNASLILTGDKDLLVLHPFRGIAILNPADFLAR